MRGRVLALCFSILGTTTCGGTGAPATVPDAGSEAPDVGLVVAVERSRLFEQQRTMAVTVDNRGAASVSLVDPWLDSGRHEVADAPPRVVTVGAGRRVTFPMPYGAPRCAATDPAITVEAEVGGRPARFEAPVTEAIAAAHQRECAAERARAAVELDFADDWVVEGTTAAGTLAVRPRTPDVAVVDVQTAIVFVTEVGAPLPADADLPLAVSARRCDAHALIESKKTFTVAVHVRIGDGDPVPVEIVADRGPVRAALDQAIEACVGAQTAG